jgi:uncharacterized repeat protein (TIGR04138 family)
MGHTQDFETLVRELCGRDPRYAEGAYHFVVESLDYTMKHLGRDQETGVARHVGGRELLEGIRLYAVQCFGPLSPAVFAAWGICRTEDFGTLVFRLVEAGQLSRQESDSLADFSDGYEFREAFVRGYDVDVADARL